MIARVIRPLLVRRRLRALAEQLRADVDALRAAELAAGRRLSPDERLEVLHDRHS